MRGREGKPGKAATRFHPEKHACPRRGNPKTTSAVLRRRQTERGGKVFWDAEEFDRHQVRCWDARVASQSLRPVEAIMCALCTGQGRRREIWAGREAPLHLHLHALVTQ